MTGMQLSLSGKKGLVIGVANEMSSGGRRLA